MCVCTHIYVYDLCVYDICVYILNRYMCLHVMCIYVYMCVYDTYVCVYVCTLVYIYMLRVYPSSLKVTNLKVTFSLKDTNSQSNLSHVS